MGNQSSLVSINVVLVVALAIIIVFGVLCDLNPSLMQAVGNISGEIPGVGIWLNGLSGLNSAILKGTEETAMGMFALMMACLSENILDSVFMGLFFAIFQKMVLFIAPLRRAVIGFFLRRANYHLFCTIVSTVISVVLLYFIKKVPSQQAELILITGLDIVILVAGVVIMLGLGNGRTGYARSFVVNAVIGAFQAAAGIGLICSFFYLPTVICQKSIPLAGYLLWLLFLIAFSFILFLVSTAENLAHKGQY